MMWKEKYRVGAELIDTQHKELFHRVSNFIQAVQSPQPWENKLEHVKETLAFMQDYVIIHFNDEERFQAEIGYPTGTPQETMPGSRWRQGYAKRAADEGFTEELIQNLAATYGMADHMWRLRTRRSVPAQSARRQP